METLVKADIFFFITSLAVIAVAALAVAALFYILRILRNVRDISETVKEESESIVGDIGRFRATIREEGIQWKHIAAFFGMAPKRKRKSKGR